jgi:hypothetical protein
MTLLDVDWFPRADSNGLLVVLIVSGAITTLLAPVVFATLNSMFADISDGMTLRLENEGKGLYLPPGLSRIKPLHRWGWWPEEFSWIGLHSLEVQ